MYEIINGEVYVKPNLDELKGELETLKAKKSQRESDKQNYVGLIEEADYDITSCAEKIANIETVLAQIH